MTAGATQPLALAGREPFAIGGRRWCFVDPRDPARCVKVNRTDDLRFGRTQRGLLLPARWRRAYDNNRDEDRALRRVMRRAGAEASEHVPRVYGWVATDLGRGLVMDLIRDNGGAIARTLREHICAGATPDEFAGAVDELGAWLLRHRVLTRDLLDHNIVAQRRAAGWRLFIIDGVGDKAWLPLAAWVAPIGRAKVRRRLEGLRRRLDDLARSPTPRDQWDTARWSQGFLEHRGL